MVLPTEDKIPINLYNAVKKKRTGFGERHITSNIPATEIFGNDNTMAGQWWEQRVDVAPGTLLLLEYRWRNTMEITPNTDYLMLKADDTAPLMRIVLDLPPHPLSVVGAIENEGRFYLVDDDEQIPMAQRAAWRTYVGLRGSEMARYTFSDLMDVNAPEEDQKFRYIRLDRGQAKTGAVVRKATGKGITRRAKIVRGRKLNLR